MTIQQRDRTIEATGLNLDDLNDRAEVLAQLIVDLDWFLMDDSASAAHDDIAAVMHYAMNVYTNRYSA